ncbi:PH domain-containing protein [Candidatus Nomurabacteria bacterium]|nr:PH domain-containing protein [Candidatus Nomurabacteria bacterium]
MANEPKNKAFKKIKDVARVALGQPAVSQSPDTVISGDTPNYREDPEGVAENRANVPNEFLNLFESDASEIILEQGLRHPFMIYAIYAVTAFVVILITSLMGAVLVNPKALIGTNISENAATVIALISMFAAIFSILVGVLSAYLFGKSRLILTNQKIVLIHYHSLFSREVSQLNIADVEDVNVSQPTIIDRLAKSGTITIETAGEQTNYVLTWVNKPYEFAKHTIQSHEGSIAEYGN